jgi:hypothetical protein
MSLRIASFLVVAAAAATTALGCGGNSQTTAERWDNVCRTAVAERTAAKLATAEDFRRFVAGGHRTLERLREVAPNAELDPRQRDALAAFAAQRELERQFLVRTTRRPLAEVAAEFSESTAAASSRVRRAFIAAGASECAKYPVLR